MCGGVAKRFESVQLFNAAPASSYVSESWLMMRHNRWCLRLEVLFFVKFRWL